MSRQPFGRRLDAWLDEPENEQFTTNKWRFWLPAVLGFSILNSVLTVLIFRESESANYLTPALLAASAIVGWLAIGCLHYSDAKRGRMARGVSALDSVSLLFVLFHFCLLVFVLGHSWILRSAERKYAVELATWNENAQRFHAGNEKIAEAIDRAEASRKETARIEADAAYQYRKAAERGVRIKRESAGGINANIELAKVELPPPPKAPEDTQDAFLARWDAIVRLTNFGELILAAVTLIFIRNWTAKSNTVARQVEDFPSELDADIAQDRGAPRLDRRTRKSDSGRLSPISGDLAARKEALKKLREHLKAISFHNPGRWFKADLVRGGVTIRLFEKQSSHEIMVCQTDQSDKLLAAVDRPDFRARLVEELIRQGFPIEKGIND